ncbi:alpha/beta hydrolase [bacterium]|nr:alpha/beta hydrolase [bacterium]
MASYLENFNYQILGNNANPKLVFLHGLMGFGSNWKTMARHFEDQYQILLYDQRGHGRSIQPEKGYRIEDYVSDLEHILSELGWGKIVLVGHSMGARVAAAFAEKNPQSTEKLILVDMGPTSNMATMISTEEKIKSVPVPFVSREEARAYFDGPFLEKYKNETLKQFFYANLETQQNAEMKWRFYLPGVLETLWQSRTSDQWRAYSHFSMPTLLVRGEKSADFPQPLFDEVLVKNKKITGVVLSGAGHWVHVEKPRELQQIFADFLKK